MWDRAATVSVLRSTRAHCAGFFQFNDCYVLLGRLVLFDLI
jgi:hypothetical protein